MIHNRVLRIAPLTLVSAALVFFTGCLSVGEGPDGIAVLVIISGNTQTLAPGSTNAAPLVVRALDASAAPLPGATVTWTVSQGSGTVSAATTITDDSGEASVNFTPGNATGANQIKASSSGLTVTFQINVEAAN
jgi:hypothetical protein